MSSKQTYPFLLKGNYETRQKKEKKEKPHCMCKACVMKLVLFIKMESILTTALTIGDSQRLWIWQSFC